eukprot:TRINITY_DN5003_c0_g1_i4.p1 TRINITY_DN5003_c0_g1~~TRINITY_DN5003_c0_g1_i4.p1  ORF type:complete len:270 (-),score=96.97 TRINITY_DN5003_c0_g1_i4:242-1051(-)
MGCGGSSQKNGQPGKISYRDDPELVEVHEHVIKYTGSEPITEIEYMRCAIGSIQSALWTMHADSLQIVNFSTNKLTKFPTELCSVKGLKQLKLSSNQISLVPDEICELKELTILGLGDNALTQIPNSIGQMTKLSQLLLNNNQLQELPSSICNLKELTSLQILVNPGIKELPKKIGKLKLMTNLNASYCGLVVLPDSIGDCTKLRKLEVNGNNLTDLPNSCEALLEIVPKVEFKLRDNQFPIELLEKYEPSAAKIARAAEQRRAEEGEQ